jgi:hypothetical protein
MGELPSQGYFRFRVFKNLNTLSASTFESNLGLRSITIQTLHKIKQNAEVSSCKVSFHADPGGSGDMKHHLLRCRPSQTGLAAERSPRPLLKPGSVAPYVFLEVLHILCEQQIE